MSLTRFFFPLLMALAIPISLAAQTEESGKPETQSWYEVYGTLDLSFTGGVRFSGAGELRRRA